MIKAEHKKWARFIFIPYMNRLLKKNFSNFYLVNNFPKISNDQGLVITPNHISWWDGFFAEYVLSKFVNRKIYLMMLEEQLNNYRFFRKLGAFSINPKSSKSIIETSSYTKSIVEDPANFVITYPQGEIEPFEKRPILLKKGLKFFINGINRNFLIVPIAFKIQYFNKKHPSVFVRFGNPVNGYKTVKDFSVFEKEFAENIEGLSEAAFAKNYIMDLFEI